MTIGEKIARLRTDMNVSQEELAEKLSVSRQSVSKWEMDISLPQIDKIIAISEIFSVSADELLRDSVKIERKRNKYFGTDGFRGKAGVELTATHAYKVGRFLGWYYSKENGKRARIVIGKDTRLSSYMLEYSVAAGITASGADAYMLHVTTTPSVSYVASRDEFDCGIIITASHNPYHDNGIKIINRYGEKLDDETVGLIEAYLDGDMSVLGVTSSELPLASGDRIGKIVDYVSGRNRYLGFLMSIASNSYKDLKIGIDSANGASWMIAKSVFSSLGARVYDIGTSPDGVNVNKSCGSTHPEALQELVRKEHLDMGFAFDGDADRCIAVDEKGNIVDGDKILYILACRLKSRGILNGDTVAVTVMSNSALSLALGEKGIKTVRTPVGDKFVYECMQKGGYSLGGENSGHIILKKYATTGDGLLTAIMLTEEVCDKKTSLSKLAEPIKLFPQITKNIKVKDKDTAVIDEEVKKEVEKAEKEIGEGRVLLRKSGTEPLVRIMAEAKSEELCRAVTERIAGVMKERGHILED